MSLFRSGTIASLLILAGCGSSVGAGKASDGLGTVVSKDTSPYALLELATGKVTYFNDLPDGDVNLLKTTHMAFRRVKAGGSDALVGVFEVTQRQWRILNSALPPGTWPWEGVDDLVSATAAHGDAFPAYNLEPQASMAVVDAYGPAGSTARLALPSDAQWTAACGVASGWSWAATATPAELQAQVADHAAVRESLLSRSAGGVDAGGPEAVGTHDANGLGFFDIHGNVWELVGAGGHARGGSWRDSVWQSRSECVLGSGEGFHLQLDYTLVGMRLVLLP